MDTNFNLTFRAFLKTLSKAHGTHPEFGSDLLRYALEVEVHLKNEGNKSDKYFAEFTEKVTPYKKRLGVERDATVFDECDFFKRFHLWDLYVLSGEEERKVIMDSVRNLVSSMSISGMYASIPGSDDLMKMVGESVRENGNKVDPMAIIDQLVSSGTIASMIAGMAEDREAATGMVDNMSALVGADMSQFVTEEDLDGLGEAVEDLDEDLAGMKDQLGELMGSFGIDLGSMMGPDGLNLGDLVNNTEVTRKLKEIAALQKEELD